MFRIIAAAAALLAAQLALAAPAYACKGDKILFEDDFSAPDPSWGVSPEFFQVKDGKLTMTPAPERAYMQYFPGFVFDDADICITMTALETTDPARGAGGLTFWVKDNNNLFVVTVTPNGFYSVSRKIQGEWTVLVPPTKSDAIAEGLNKPNTLDVTLKGQQVTIAINDKEVKRFRGQSPDRPTSVGLYAGSGPNKPDVWQFTNLKVTNVK